ncbi:MAG: CPBP family intramembrane metalloprotease [Pelolinea sp.]|nr:CPBP family intramembrane metalloprotease [Pelolinea sp.]
MVKKEQVKNTDGGLQIWKVIGVFALVFAAVQLAVAVFDVGIDYLMRLINASDNLSVFVGSTVSRIGMIAMILLITTPVIRSILKDPDSNRIYPRVKYWYKDLFAGIGISAIAMLIVFLVELAFGWIRVSGLMLEGAAVDNWLRVMWLSILINLTAVVGEEVLYRGLLLEGIKESWDERGALFISAIIFGASQIAAAGAKETNWLQFIPFLALPGVMLGWAYLKSGNLWLPTGLHFAWNLFQNDIFNLTGAHRGDTLFGFVTNVTGPKWAVGKSYGIEVGAVGILGLVLVSIGVWWWTKNREKQSI